jgi:hypothetical protein
MTLPESTPDIEPPKVAVLLPGSGYTAQAPLLYWCGVLLREAGWHVEVVEWTVTNEDIDNPIPFVEYALTTAFNSAPPAATRLIVAKSFGSFALPWAVKNAVPGVWLTPILTDPVVSAALASADGTHLAVGGSRDPMWVPENAEGTDASLGTLEDGDHRLEVDEGWQASLDAQYDLFERIALHVAALP